MEEDIELLEEMKANCIKGMMKGAIYTDPKAERKALAIENLIKGYREIENQNRQYKIAYKLMEKEALQDREEFIPKSKIKEKIEKLKSTNTEDNLIEAIRNCEVVLLTELMEEK